MIIFIPEFEPSRVGGGWTFLRNFQDGMLRLNKGVSFTKNYADADIVFIPSVTMVDRDAMENAKGMGKPIVFRADNVPKKSRNKRNRVYDNMKRYAEIADLVIYQSQWAMEYCMPLTGVGEVIYNGVDTKIFYPNKSKLKAPRYLFAFHGKNEVKGFGLAHYLFERYFRENPAAEFWFIYNFKGELGEQQNSNYDFWNGEKYRHLDFVSTREEMSELLRQCTHLIYPAYADAAPNMVLEARACGLEVVGLLDPKWSGVSEMLDPKLDISLGRMCLEYLAMFNLVLEDKAVEINKEV